MCCTCTAMHVTKNVLKIARDEDESLSVLCLESHSCRVDAKSSVPGLHTHSLITV